MEKFNFEQPNYLMCQIAIEDGTQNDDRIWIYHRPSLSLIEFINVDEFGDFQFTGKQDRFEYEGENWFGVFVQNNCDQFEHNEDAILKGAWKYLSEFFRWDENNI